MSEPVLNCVTSGAVATVTLNRPAQFNALNEELRKALRDAVVQLENEDAVRVVILKGAGRGFCAGADLSGGFESEAASFFIWYSRRCGREVRTNMWHNTALEERAVETIRNTRNETGPQYNHY